MGAGPYTPTQWNEGASPGISAERLNRFEQAHQWMLNNAFTEAERDAIPSGELWPGRVIFNLDTSSFQGWDGERWSGLGGGETSEAIFYMGGF